MHFIKRVCEGIIDTRDFYFKISLTKERTAIKIERKAFIGVVSLALLAVGCVPIGTPDIEFTAEVATSVSVGVTEPSAAEVTTAEAAEQTVAEDTAAEITEETAIEVIAPPPLIPRNSLTDEEINALDNTCLDYGQGVQVDDKNRPTGGLMIQEKIAEYDGNIVLDSDNEIYLTFDQGYENGYTAKILDTLKEKNVKAIFFLTGDYAKRNADLVQRMIDEGHVLGNHGLRHESLPTLSIEAAEAEIMELHNYVLENFGYEMTLFRPPCGQYSEKALAITQRLGYRTFLWSFAYADWDVNNQPEIETAFERVSSAAHGGEICLLHSVSETNSEILGRVIDSMREQGFTLTTPKFTD